MIFVDSWSIQIGDAKYKDQITFIEDWLVRGYKRNPRIIERYKKEIYFAIRVDRDNGLISIYDFEEEG